MRTVCELYARLCTHVSQAALEILLIASVGICLCRQPALQREMNSAGHA